MLLLEPTCFKIYLYRGTRPGLGPPAHFQSEIITVKSFSDTKVAVRKGRDTKMLDIEKQSNPTTRCAISSCG